MTTRIRGSFDVELTPQPAADPSSPWVPGRMTIDKRYHGALEATSQGAMLAVYTEEKGSAGYVAMERVVGTLAGREGSFILQHAGSMDRGAEQLSIMVIPGSGTGALQGLRGRMEIIISEGKHEYALAYELPPG